MVSAPITYSVDGEQYVAVTVGWGTAFGLITGARQDSLRSRVLAFKLGGREQLPSIEPSAERWPELLPVTGSPQQIEKGRDVYLTRCFMCHGDSVISSGVVPDLRLVGPKTHQIWNSIVLDGASARLGMPGFDKILTKDDVEAIRQYVLKRAHDTRPAAK